MRTRGCSEVLTRTRSTTWRTCGTFRWSGPSKLTSKVSARRGLRGSVRVRSRRRTERCRNLGTGMVHQGSTPTASSCSVVRPPMEPSKTTSGSSRTSRPRGRKLRVLQDRYRHHGSACSLLAGDATVILCWSLPAARLSRSLGGKPRSATFGRGTYSRAVSAVGANCRPRSVCLLRPTVAEHVFFEEAGVRVAVLPGARTHQPDPMQSP
mmetsp:Transcript_790/g.2729  ORF Transcript_790/g.2729 Transcript_790/m.2729 type:complete len:209 (-) Transcript_790:243-869(-)